MNCNRNVNSSVYNIPPEEKKASPIELFPIIPRESEMSAPWTLLVT